MTDQVPEVGVNAARVNLAVNQRASFYGEITWENADQSPKSLSGFTTAVLSVAQRIGEDPLFTLTLGHGITLEPSARTGVIAISMTPEQTGLLAKSGVYDLLLVDGAAFVSRVAEGRVLLDRGVSTS